MQRAMGLVMAVLALAACLPVSDGSFLQKFLAKGADPATAMTQAVSSTGTPDLYDTLTWLVMRAAKEKKQKVAQALLPLLQSTTRQRMMQLMDDYDLPPLSSASGSQMLSYLSGKDAPGLTVLLPDTIGMPKSVRQALLPFALVVGKLPQGPNEAFRIAAAPDKSFSTYGPLRNKFINGSFVLSARLAKLAPVGKPFSYTLCKGIKLPVAPGVSSDSCSRMLRRVTFQVVEYDLPQARWQYERLLEVREWYSNGAAQNSSTASIAAAESDASCTQEPKPPCDVPSDANGMADGVDLLGRAVKLDGKYGESSMVDTMAPNAYNFTKSDTLGRMVTLQFSDPNCPGQSHYACVYVPVGVYLATSGVGVRTTASSTTSSEYYSETAVSASVSAGTEAFKGEVDASYTSTSLSSSSYYSAKVYADQRLYTVSIDWLNANPYITDAFKKRVADLNAALASNPNDTATAKALANDYGCYQLTGLYIGGKYRMSTSYSIYTTNSTQQAELNVDMEYEDYAASADAGATTAQSSVDQEATLFWRAVGGEPTAVANYTAWSGTVWSSNWVMMDTTNYAGSYQGTLKITDDHGPLMQSGGSEAARKAVDDACVWQGTSSALSTMTLAYHGCNMTCDTKSNPQTWDACTFNTGDVTVAPEVMVNNMYQQNFITGLCSKVDSDNKMIRWGTWLQPVGPDAQGMTVKDFSSGTNGNDFRCDPYQNCTVCGQSVGLQACVTVPPGTAVVGICIIVNGDKNKVTAMQLWYSKIYTTPQDNGLTREVFSNSRYKAYIEDGQEKTCDSPGEYAIIKLDDSTTSGTGNPTRFKNKIITGVASRYKDASKDYLAVYTAELMMNTA